MNFLTVFASTLLCILAVSEAKDITCRKQSRCYEGCVQRFTWCLGFYKQNYPRCDNQLKRCIDACTKNGCPRPKEGNCPNLVVTRCNPGGSSHVINYCTEDQYCDGDMKCCPMVDSNQTACLKLCVPPIE